MKKIFLLLFYFIISFNCFSQTKLSVIDVQHYIFDLQLSDSTDNIIGKATVVIKFLQRTSSFQLDLINKNADGKGMTVSKIVENNKELTFEHSNNIITIHLSSGAEKNESRSFEIYYSGIPIDGLIIAKNKYQHRTFFSDNWPNRAHHWIPCDDKPADKASVEFIVTAPLHYKVISNGVLIEESNVDSTKKITHWKEDIALPTKVMVIGVADFAVNYPGNVESIPVSSWVYPENKERGFYDYAEAMEILPFFIKNVGAYPFMKLANVQSKTIFGGMENASAIFYYENSVSGDRKSESLLTHEIAHQWFGDYATETDFSHLWLSEGFATYMTDLYFEHKYGTDTLIKMLTEQRKEVIEFAKQKFTPVVDTFTTNYMDLLNANSYQKGGWILHMLRRKIGDDLFWKSIREYYAEYGGKNANTKDLENVIEKISHVDLNNFFRQWLYTGGYPKLDIKWKYNERKKIVTITIEQTQSSLFDFPLQISLQNNTEKESHSINIKEKITAVDFPVQSKPSQLITDPKTNLLFEASVREIK